MPSHAVASPMRPPQRPVAGHRRAATVLRPLLVVSWIGTFGFFLFWGMEYYVLPLHERAYSELHDLFKPTGSVGNRLGIAGTLLLVVGVGSYMIRKRWRRLHGLGKLRDWLSFHIWCCTLGPALVLLHTAFRIGGLVAIAFWSMMLVVASGVVGRYVYVRIPKTLNGRFHTMEELAARQRELLEGMQDGYLSPDELSRLETAVTPVPPRNLFHALALGLRYDVGGRRLEAELQQSISSPRADGPVPSELLEAAREYRRLARQRALLEPFERVFRYWHTFHLPLAIVMLLIVLLHIGVAIAFGYAWTP